MKKTVTPVCEIIVYARWKKKFKSHMGSRYVNSFFVHIFNKWGFSLKLLYTYAHLPQCYFCFFFIIIIKVLRVEAITNVVTINTQKSCWQNGTKKGFDEMSLRSVEKWQLRLQVFFFVLSVCDMENCGMIMFNLWWNMFLPLSFSLLN